jgi:glutamyl-tRNA reductase
LQVYCAGLNHKTAPLSVRESLSFSKSDLQDAILTLRGYVNEGVILSTCNRTEVYAIAKDGDAALGGIDGFFASFGALTPEALASHLYRYQGEEAARHLFRVASGLDSMILGEHQILGQVRDALTASAAVATPSVPLSRLFHYALRTGRRVRDETDISKNALSVSYAGVRLAQRVLGDLRDKSALLVGAGEAGTLVARALRASGVGKLTIANRTLSKAEELSLELHGEAVTFDDISEALETSDILISATEAPEAIFTRDKVAGVMVGRGERPLFAFDLAVPRDIDPQAGEIDGVHLFNIDDLESVAEENRRERLKSAGVAEAIVEEELQRFSKWWRSLEAKPLIQGLRREAESIRKAELEKALRKLPDLTPEQQKALEQFSRALANKLLHKPMESLKSPKAPSHLQAIKELYQVADGEDPDQPDQSDQD